MPEQAAASETTLPNTTVDSIKAELDQQMAISLNGGNLPAESAAAASTDTTVETSTTTPSDPFGLLKDKFGYDTPEAAVQEIETLRAFRAAPPAAELKFENEQSKLAAEALQAGNFKQVYEMLDQQVRIDRLTGGDVTPETAAEIVKYGMQLKYKDLTPAEINYKFNKQFALPAKPGLLPTEDQEEYEARVAAWDGQIKDKEMELLIEAKLARPDLIASKSKLVFPTIARPEEAAFQEWQKNVQENERLAGETTQAYKAFTPKSIETKINFKDEANKIDFDFIHEPDPESFNKVIAMTADIDNFWQSFINPDGTPDRKGFLEALYFAKNREKVIVAAMNQAKNATIKSTLPDNSSGGLVRQMPQTQELNDVDKLMRLSLKGYGGF